MAGKQVKGLKIYKQKGTDNTLFARWTFDNKDVDSYEIKWQYSTGDTYTTTDPKNKKKKKNANYWFDGSTSTVKLKLATYSPPSNAVTVRANVKPIAKTKNDKNKTPKFNGAWVKTWATYAVRKAVPPNTPPTPTVTMGRNTLTATVDNYQFLDSRTVDIDYQVVENDKKVIDSATYRLSKTKSHLAGWSSFKSQKITAGNRYKVRVRAKTYGPLVTSPWTDYTENQYAIPDKVTPNPTAKAYSEDSLLIEWKKSSGSKSYEIEYADSADKIKYSTGSQTDSSEKHTGSDDKYDRRIISGLSSATRWYFRVRGVNDTGNGAWSGISSQVLATKPSAPTTWSYSEKASPGNTVTLNWTHNTQDGSEQQGAKVKLVVSPGGDANTTTITLDGKFKALGYVKVNTSTGKVIIGTGSVEKGTAKEVAYKGTITDGSTLTWQVQTKGLHPDFSSFSGARAVNFYAKPTISLSMTPTEEDAEGTLGVTGFPVTIEMTVKPTSQKALGASLSIVNDGDGYHTEIANGEDIFVASGDSIYSKTIAIELEADESAPYANKITFTLTPGDIHFEPGAKYKIDATAAMDTGLTARSTSFKFASAIKETPFEPSAEILVDYDALTASIRPFVLDEFGGESYPPGAFSVYRRETDGSFTRIYEDIDSSTPTVVTDPHPALDYARYRIIFRSAVTGSIDYVDMPGVPTEETAVVLQWDEGWTYFDIAEDAEEEEAPAWTGSLLRLPYNIDVSDNFAQDVALVEYIGRENPVSYYGTQKGYTSQWKVEVPKSDVDTIASIRKLARYPGDVYVREPSGTGYYAQVNVSYSISHNNPIVQVSFDIKKVSNPEDGNMRRITVDEEIAVDEDEEVQPQETTEVEEGA